MPRVDVNSNLAKIGKLREWMQTVSTLESVLMFESNRGLSENGVCQNPMIRLFSNMFAFEMQCCGYPIVRHLNITIVGYISYI